jgi:PAS domain S-box-containing protein
MGYELIALKKNGEEVPYEATASILTYMGEKAELVFLHDISERRKSEWELLRNKQELDSIYNTVGDVIFQLKVEDGNKFRFNSVNKTFSIVTGIDASMVIGKAVSEIIPEPSLSMVLQNYQKAIEQKTVVRWEEKSVYPTGTLTGIVSIAPVFDANGKCTHLVGSVHDITERKSIEDKIKKLNEELEERVILRTKQLENANKELEAFAYSVSHDLRAPLRAISGFSKILTEDYSEKIEAEGRRVCNVIQNETSRMGQLIDDLLAFSRLSRSSMQTALTDMKPMVEEIFSETKRQYENKQVIFISGDIESAIVDVNLMRQVWANLFSNAFKFSSRKEIIEIETGCYREKDEIIYFIKDKGAGFDMKYIDKLFGVFQRLHNLNEFQGTGVGLAIVQRIIHRHGGRVWAEGEINIGAKFYFSLPNK